MRMRVPRILPRTKATKMRVTRATPPGMGLFRTRLHAHVERNVNLLLTKYNFANKVDLDFKRIDNTKGLVKDAKELVEKLLPILDEQEEQILEQRVKVKGLALQLNDIVDFLNNCRAQEEKITIQWQNR
jgi:hypothetical protein